jgi:hypothetical protein
MTDKLEGSHGNAGAVPVPDAPPSPQDSPARVDPAHIPPGRGLIAAEGPTVPALAAAPGVTVPPPGGVRSPQGRTGEARRSAPSSVPESAPGISPLPGAESGKVESPRTPARTAPAAAWGRGRSTTSRTPVRRQTTGPGCGGTGPVPASPPAFEGLAGAGRKEGPGTATPGAGPESAQDPAGGTRSGSRSSTSPPADGDSFRMAWKAAESANAKAKRTGRSRYSVKRQGGGYRPGSARRMPPPGSGGTS